MPNRAVRQLANVMRARGAFAGAPTCVYIPPMPRVQIPQLSPDVLAACKAAQSADETLQRAAAKAQRIMHIGVVFPEHVRLMNP